MQVVLRNLFQLECEDSDPTRYVAPKSLGGPIPGALVGFATVFGAVQHSEDTREQSLGTLITRTCAGSLSGNGYRQTPGVTRSSRTRRRVYA